MISPTEVQIKQKITTLAFSVPRFLSNIFLNFRASKVNKPFPPLEIYSTVKFKTQENILLIVDLTNDLVLFFHALKSF